jgi:hypothetical protein
MKAENGTTRFQTNSVPHLRTIFEARGSSLQTLSAHPRSCRDMAGMCQ